MAVYDNRQTNRMRQDSMRRPQEIHRHSMVNASHYSQGRQVKSEIPEIVQSEVSGVSEKSFRQVNPDIKTNPLSAIMEIIAPDGKLDSDKLMIIALMIILAREGADIKLIAALGYILL